MAIAGAAHRANRAFAARPLPGPPAVAEQCGRPVQGAEVKWRGKTGSTRVILVCISHATEPNALPNRYASSLAGSPPPRPRRFRGRYTDIVRGVPGAGSGNTSGGQYPAVRGRIVFQPAPRVFQKHSWSSLLLACALISQEEHVAHFVRGRHVVLQVNVPDGDREAAIHGHHGDRVHHNDTTHSGVRDLR